jgi:hypothetical protein
MPSNAPTDTESTNLIYIAGAGRSGSTLLSQVLGSIDGCINLGEFTGYLLNGKQSAKKLPCSCSHQPEECEFWKPYAGVEDDILRTGSQVTRITTGFLMFLGINNRLSSGDMTRYKKKISAILADIQRCKSAGVLVDSSKSPSIAFVLSQMQNVNLHVIHLFRDPRAFVASRSREKGYLKRLSLARSLATWISYNLLASMLRYKVKKYLRISYDAFCMSPEDTINNVYRYCFGVNPAVSFLSRNKLKVNQQHILAGNPDKFDSDEIQIVPKQWNLSTAKQAIVLACTWFQYYFLKRDLNP